MEKRIIYAAVSIMIFVFSPAHALTLLAEQNIDRVGCDFRSFVVPGANGVQFSPVCKNACGLDQNCMSWNFDPRSGKNMCFLKMNFCPPTVSFGTVGGLKLTATMSDMEPEIDRPGCDFSSFPAKNPLLAAGADPKVCMITCAEDNRCAAWNFDPGVGTGTCFLKSCAGSPPAPVAAPPGMMSGVKFDPPAIQIPLEKIER
jgi:PAN domain